MEQSTISAEEKANVLNNFFTEQTHLDETNASLSTADTINNIITGSRIGSKVVSYR